MLALALLLALGTARAQPRDAGRVQAGEDLARWRALQRDDPGDVDALLAFIEDFPSSPLAELAYGALVAAEAELPADFRGSLSRVSSSYHRHREALTRQPAAVAVATLELEPKQEPERPEVRLLGRVDRGERVAELGLGMSAQPGLYMGLGARLGPIGLAGRGLLDEEGLRAGAALRYEPWRYWRLSPFAELSWVGGAGASLGLSRSLPGSLTLDLAAGAQRRPGEDAPEQLLRLGVAQGF